MCQAMTQANCNRDKKTGSRSIAYPQASALFTAALCAAIRRTAAVAPASLDHLVGGREQRRRQRDAQRPRGLEIDRHLEFARKRNGQVARLFTLEDAGDIDSGLTVRVWKARPVTHQPAGGDGLVGAEDG